MELPPISPDATSLDLSGRRVSITAGVMTGVVIVGALLAIGAIGAMQLRNDDRPSDESFLKLLRGER